MSCQRYLIKNISEDIYEDIVYQFVCIIEIIFNQYSRSKLNSILKKSYEEIYSDFKHNPYIDEILSISLQNVGQLDLYFIASYIHSCIALEYYINESFFDVERIWNLSCILHKDDIHLSLVILSVNYIKYLFTTGNPMQKLLFEYYGFFGNN